MKMMIAMRFKILIFFLSVVQLANSQTKEESKILKEYNTYSALAAEEINKGDFAQAEALYRKALSKKPDGDEAAYNFGNLYFDNAKAENSAQRYLESVKATEDKSIKHRNYHNLGNLFMEKKDYANAVKAYKNALRNDPTDEETRYNLALAKKMQEKDQQNQGQDQNKDQQDKDKKDKDKDNKGGEGDQEKKNEKQQDKKEGDDKNENQQPNKDSKENPKDGDNQKQQQPSKPESQKGKMSEQQIKNLLQAIENKEKDTQEKLNTKKVKGAKVKTEKDW
jgi:tetratricopeptide (TPR) repeat protein